MARLVIGTSGWVYGAWKGRFYPLTLPHAQQLGYFANHFDTTEVNYSFYHVPSVETYRRWLRLVPPDFLFALKAHRAITHVGRLRNVGSPWHDFVEAAGTLQQHLGPILLQFPPSFGQNHSDLRAFLEMTGLSSRPLRLAFEFRHASWFTDETYRLLSRYSAALCIADGLRYPRVHRITADFTYLRFHGRMPPEAPLYTDDELRQEATFVNGLISRGTDVYAYFNNDALAHAPANATRLKEFLNEIRCAA